MQTRVSTCTYFLNSFTCKWLVHVCIWLCICRLEYVGWKWIRSCGIYVPKLEKFTYVYNCIVCHTVERYILHHNDIGLRTYCCVDIKTGTCDINKQTLFHTSHVISYLEWLYRYFLSLYAVHARFNGAFKNITTFFVKSVSFFLVADEFPAEEGRERE